MAAGSSIDRYLNRGMAHVHGWLDKLSARMIARLSLFQTERGYSGATGEIGIHHGKLWLILHLTSKPDETCFAIDVFEDQEKNIDGSGEGNRKQFMSNIERHSVSDGNVLIWQTSSLEISPAQLLGRCGPARLISIDGGHTAECTSNDLWLADRGTQACGIVVLDDYFNPTWPDVSAGAARYFLDPASELRPFAIAPNKVFLARQEPASMYRSELRAAFGSEFLEKRSRMFGEDVDIYGIEASTPKARLVRAAKRTYWGWRASLRR